ncbi:MAG: monovalent cation:H+ antiporter-2, family [Euryarchaeota archaeon]|nr:monovalent cation:H+ antiporter-2, family [Euryarchaeota archaeon]
MEMPLLGDIAVIFVLSVLVLFIFHKIKAPTIVGFLVTGVLAGPQGMGLIQAVDQVEVLSEIGVILLLFTIGLEVSLKDLMKIKKYVLVGGSLQVSLTILAVYAIMRFMDYPAGTSILLGFLVSLSSTAIVLRIIQSKDELYTPQGRTILGILIFQDIAIVPLMLATPLLPGAIGDTTDSSLAIIARGLGLIVLVIISAKWIVPTTLYHIARIGDRELFLLSLVGICFAVAWITSLAGLSLGLGAFLAGLTISESQYSHQAFGSVLPLRDAFTSFFFVSIGMLLDVNFLMQNPQYILLLASGVMLLKALIAGTVIAFLGLPLRITILVGLALSQIGEFSFVLSKVGLEYALLSKDIYQIFLDVAVLTMAATSFIISISPKIADAATRLPRSRKSNHSEPPIIPNIEVMKDHVIIVGYGVNGRNVARSAKNEGIPYVVIDIDPEIVDSDQRIGEPISYGDATQDYVLRNAGIANARVMVIAISDRSATRRITDLARRMNRDVYIIARTRYIHEIKILQNLGANEVIPEEYETSLEIFSRVLEKYQVPRKRIESFIDLIRSDGYEMFRSISTEPFCSSDLSNIRNDFITLKVSEGSLAAGRTIKEIELKEKGANLLAIDRDSQIINYPDENFVLQPEDVAILLGSESEISSFEELFKKGAES